MRSSFHLAGLALLGSLAVLSPSLSQGSVIPAIKNLAPFKAFKALEAREGTGIDGMGFASIILAVVDFLKDQNAYDESVPDKCILYMSTTNGGNCNTWVQCGDEGTGYWLPDWNVCYVNGRQYFTDPKIGDFSITFTEAGGVDGNTEDGLHHPVFQAADIDNWDKLDVQAEADKQLNRKGGGSLCEWTTGASSGVEMAWTCGIPWIGATDNGFGISSDTIVHTSTYAPGWCTMHIEQFQRNENGIGADFAFTAIMHDADGTAIGQITKQPIDSTTKALDMDSNLPYVLVINTGGADTSPLDFSYAGTTWTDSDATHCKFGAYSGGSRNGDCGFTCAAE